MTVVKSAFEAQYGFKSPGFAVDDQGNVTLKSITYTVTEEEVDLAGDFLVRQAGNAFTVDGYYQAGSDVNLQPNPALEVIRGSTYVFNLKLRELNQAGQLLGNFSFNIFTFANGIWTEYSSGITHTSVDGLTTKTGQEAQGQFEGKVTFAVPDNAPSALAFGNSDQIPLCTITAIDPTVTGIGTFSRITSVGNVTAVGENAIITLSPTGSSGTVNIQPSNGGTLSNLDVNANLLTALDAVTLSPANAAVTIAPSGSGGTIIVNPGTTGLIDNVDIGTINPGTVATDNLVSTGGTINNTVIGNTRPADATFNTASVVAAPASTFNITNKRYVDNRAVAMAVAFGV